jgi:hypothetical protein
MRLSSPARSAVLDVRGGVNPRDPDARFTRKRDKTYFGYKAHLAVDEASGLVRQAEDDLGQCARLPPGRGVDPGRRAGLFRRQGL